jgi:hypothetical protein
MRAVPSPPRVFIGGVCIGGGSDCQAKAATGELRRLVEAAGALRASGAEFAAAQVARHPVPPSPFIQSLPISGLQPGA